MLYFRKGGRLFLTFVLGLVLTAVLIAAHASLTPAASPAIITFQTAHALPDPAHNLFLGSVSKEYAIPDLPPPLPAPLIFSSTTAVNFAAAHEQMQNNGLQLATNKIGFHVGPGGNAHGLADDWWRPLDAAGVPVFLKSVDSAGALQELQEQMKISGVPHTLVYRRTSPYDGADSWVDPDVPDYNLDPITAAHQHWEYHKAGFPPELDKNIVWFETVNEVDKNRSVWLAQFALETAKLAVADGYKWAAFGWSAGEPEPEHWDSPAMREFLRYAGQHPQQIAVALHEYSYLDADIGNIYPYLIGRFQTLFDVCDRRGIPRPTILVTEWGWTYQSVPTADQALDDIAWAAWLYAAYPQVKGAAIWYLGPGFGGIANKAQPLIAPVGDYSLKNYFGVTPGWGRIAPSIFEP